MSCEPHHTTGRFITISQTSLTGSFILKIVMIAPLYIMLHQQLIAAIQEVLATVSQNILHLILNVPCYPIDINAINNIKLLN